MLRTLLLLMLACAKMLMFRQNVDVSRNVAHASLLNQCFGDILQRCTNHICKNICFLLQNADTLPFLFFRVGLIIAIQGAPIHS